MRVVIEQSWRLLEAADQEVLGRLALFRGSFSQEAAAAVAGARPEQLEEFISKSWLRQYATGRYTMHELLRQYAEEQLQTSSTYAAQRRAHFAYFRAFFDRADRGMRSAEQATWIQAIDTDIDNIRAALTWALETPVDLEAGMQFFGSMLWFIYFRNYWNESRHWAELFLSHPEAPQYPHARAAILLLVGGLCWLQGENETARRCLTESLDIYQHAQDTSGYAYACTVLGYTLLAVGAVEQARQHLNEAIVLFRSLVDDWGLSLALVSLSELEIGMGDLESAHQRIEEAFAYALPVNPAGSVYVSCLRGRVAYLEGDLDRATMLLHEALERAQGFGVKRYMAVAHLILGRVTLAQHVPSLAYQHLLAAYRLFLDLAERPALAECLESFAHLTASKGQVESAARYLGLANQLRDATGVPVAPVDQMHYVHVLRSIQEHLNSERWRALFAIGRLIDPEHLLQDLERQG